MTQPPSPGVAIKLLRERSGLTARNLATMAGVSESYLSKVENGNQNPSSEWIGNVMQIISAALISASSSDGSEVTSPNEGDEATAQDARFAQPSGVAA